MKIKVQMHLSSFTAWSFFLSSIFMSLLFSISGDDKYINLSIPFAILFGFYFFLIRGIHTTVLKEPGKRLMIFSVTASLFAQSFFGRSFYNWAYAYIERICTKYGCGGLTAQLRLATTALVTLFSFPAVCLFFYIAYREILKILKKLYESIGKTERVIFVSHSLFFTVLIVVSYCLTCVFSIAYYKNGMLYDIIYSSDSTALYYTNAWLNIGDAENDLRQPLFAVFSAPFAVIPYALSVIFSAIPLFSFIPNLYAYLFAIGQAMLLMITILLLTDLLDLKGVEKALACSVFAFSFPALLFSLNLEQYVFAVFWAILYLYSHKKKWADSDQLLLCATGSLLTSAVFFPLVYKKERTLKQNLLRIISIGVLFVALCFVFGRGAYLLGSIDQVKKMLTWAGGDIPFIQRLYQYSAFIASCFVYPETHVVKETIQQVPPSGFHYGGIVILILAVIGFVVTRKRMFSKISFAWVCFSFVMLVMVGWGSKENGMVLYSLYFGWAFISLIIGLITAIPKKLSPLRITLFSLFLIPLLYFNTRGLIAILDFATKYYLMVWL